MCALFYNIKFKSRLWTPSQNSFLHVLKLIPIFIVLAPVPSKPIFMLKKISYPHQHAIFQCIYLSYSHHKPIFYAYSMSESYTWDVVCERQRDPSYVSRERRVVTGMERWVWGMKKKWRWPCTWDFMHVENGRERNQK